MTRHPNLHPMNSRLSTYFYKVILEAILLAGLTAGCSLLGRTAIPTPFPEDYIQTAIAMTVQAGELPTSAAILNPATPLATDTPPPVTSTSNPQESEGTPSSGERDAANSPVPPSTISTEPVVTDNSTPTPGIPEAAIQIVRPGPMSKIVSSLNLVGYVNTVPNGHMRIELWLEPLTDGGQPRLLQRELQNFIADPTPRINISREYEIEISRVSEFAQLRLSTFDADNRMVALASVDLLLLSVGDKEINPSGDLREPFVILEPGENKLIQGGTVLVSGLVHSSSNQVLTVGMTAPDGRLVGIRQVGITPASDLSYVPFSVDVPYNVSEPTRVRIAVYENSGRIPGITRLSSIEVLVSP